MIIIPGNVPEYLDKCRRLEADVLVFDLQDAIAKLDAAKLQAREMVVNAIEAGGFRASEICVRVNSPASPWFVEDIKAVADAGTDSIMLSHAYSASEVTLAEGCLYSFTPARKVEILIEVDELASEALGDEPADGRLAGPSGADECETPARL